jgi:hypothetical protein
VVRRAVGRDHLAIANERHACGDGGAVSWLGCDGQLTAHLPQALSHADQAEPARFGHRSTQAMRIPEIVPPRHSLPAPR